jgi:hypothetical protein
VDRADIDFAQLIKIYGNQNGNGVPAEVRYSPRMGARKVESPGHLNFATFQQATLNAKISA